MIPEHVDEARLAGARQAEAVKFLELDERTVQRWRTEGGGGDRRRGPTTEPKNKLTAQEREQVLDTVNSQEFRDLPPKQIVPGLASRGEYVASEPTIYRILREEMTSSSTARSPARRRLATSRRRSSPGG